MSSNDFDSQTDRTVFRQPSVKSDRTVVKPSPGGRAKSISPTADSKPPEPIQHSHAYQHENSVNYFKTTQG